MECILDIIITNLDAKTYRKRDPAAVLQQKEKAKKCKYMSACLKKCKHFTPLAFSTNGLYGQEADAFMKCMASLLAKKWAHLYSQVCGWLKGCVAITIA